MTILDFDWTYLFFNSLSAFVGVISLELLFYSFNEQAYKLSTRKGDILFASWTAPFLALVGLPYFFLWADGQTILGTEITLQWYNPLICWIFGFSIDILAKALRRYLNKKTKLNEDD